MHHNPPKEKQIAHLAAVYTAMIAMIIVIVSFIVLFIMGYRFDTDKGEIEQYGLLQFSSNPSGATVKVDGNTVSSSTPNKKSIKAGTHEVVMWRDGYESWSKTVSIKSGTLVWLNYALLVPKQLSVESISNFETIAASVSSPKGHYMLIQSKSDVASFDLADISSDTVKTTKITLPTNIYTDATTAGVVHNFQITKWDDGEKYVLIKHSYADKFEWIVMDTSDVASSKNITKISNLAISDIAFFGTNGRTYYALSNAELHKIDLSSSVASKALVGGVTKFDVYNKSNIITYIATDTVDTTKTILGVYRDGDSRSYAVKTLVNNTLPISIATVHYFNLDYVAISEGSKVSILGGSYPSVDRDSSTSLKEIKTLTLDQNIDKLSFSPIGQYLLMQSGKNFASYDLEYQNLSKSQISATSEVANIKWINDNYIWSDADGKLTIREFDGLNSHTINTVTVGQDVVLTHNGRFIYSINQNTTGYQLQRVRMILP